MKTVYPAALIYPRSRFTAVLGAFAVKTAFLVCVATAQEVVFQDRFDDYPIDGVPATVDDGGPWSAVLEGSQDEAVRVVEDTEDVFGYGTGNQFLRIENGVGFNLNAEHGFESEVVTLSFDFIDQRTSISSSGAERLTIQLFADDGDIANANRAHIFSLQNGHEIRVGAGTYPDQTRLRFDMIMNNSAEEITYEHPGGTKTLSSGLADVWIDGVLSASNYSFARAAGMTAGSIRSFAFQTFSTDRFSVDLDNFTIFSGAYVLESIAYPSDAGEGTLIELSRLIRPGPSGFAVVFASPDP